MADYWQVNNSKIAYKNKWYRVREDNVIFPDGKKGLFCVLEKEKAVFIIPLTNKKEVFLVRQYRHPVKAFLWEVPAGSGRKGESNVQIAKRELREETGLSATKLILLGEFYIAPGYSNQKGLVYLAKGLKEGKRSLESAEKNLIVRKFPFSVIKQMIADGRIKGGSTIQALFLLDLYLREKSDDSGL